MNWIKKVIIESISFVTVGLITVMLINLFIVKYPHIFFKQSFFPRSLLNSVDNCYKTYYPDTYINKTQNEYTAVLGDSYGAGMGDDFLFGSYNYGIFHKLRLLDDRENYLIFARSGFGSINSARELSTCLALSRKSFFGPSIAAPKKILFLFYEGNDLNNNFDHLKLRKNDQTIKSFVDSQIKEPIPSLRLENLNFPIIDLVKSLHVIGHKHHKNALKAEGRNQIVIGNDLYRIPIDPQSAAVQLSGKTLENSLEVFYESMRWIKNEFPNAKITIVYIPSVVTCYKWKGDIFVQSYHGDKQLVTNLEKNESNSKLIRNSINKFSEAEDFKFIDTTDALKGIGSKKIIHGPKDWRHFNGTGYDEIANQIRTVN